MASTLQKASIGILTGLLVATTAQAGERYNRYDDSRHYRGHNNHHYYDRQYDRNRNKHRRRHKKRDNDSKLIAGLLFGALVGYAISNSQQEQRPQQTPQGYEAPRYVPQVEQTTSSVEQCLQTREYQTRVIINGEEVDAYGTACLQPDGSWKRGPLTVSQYDDGWNF